MNSTSQKTKALILSGLCLPGLGQVYLGKKLKGFIFILLSGGIVFYILMHFLKAYHAILKSFPISKYSHHLTEAFLKLLSLSFEQEWKVLLWGLIILIFIWILNMIDLISYLSSLNRPVQKPMQK